MSKKNWSWTACGNNGGALFYKGKRVSIGELCATLNKIEDKLSNTKSKKDSEEFWLYYDDGHFSGPITIDEAEEMLFPSDEFVLKDGKGWWWDVEKVCHSTGTIVLSGNGEKLLLTCEEFSRKGFVLVIDP